MSCTWAESERKQDYTTTCGMRFHFVSDETPIQHGFGFCPYCGKGLLIKERGTKDALTHGRVSTYSNYGCRCDPCRQAKAAYTQEYKKGRI